MNVQTDEELEKLAFYFLYHNLRDKYGWTFEYYVERHLRGVYEV